jgi:ribosomal protein S18 acetylase RimI-like enzyme
MTASIRPLRPDEVDRLPAIERAAAGRFRDIGLADVADCEVSSLAFIDACRRAGVALVAVDAADVPVGFALAGRLDDAFHLYEIDVAPEHGRRGLGRALVEAVAAAARARGLAAVTLSTFADVPWNAPFYRRCGFEVLPTDALTPALLLLRGVEAALGLPADGRVLMRWSLSA